MRFIRRVAGDVLRRWQLSPAQVAPYPAASGLFFLIGGILTASLKGYLLYPLWCVAATGVCWWIVGYFIFPHLRSRYLWFGGGLLLASVNIMAPWATYKYHMPGEEGYIEADVIVTDMMLTNTASLSWLDPKGKVEVAVKRVRLHRDAPWTECSGKLLLYDKETVFQYGQHLNIRGAVRKPFSSQLPHQFDQARYLKLKGIEHCLTAISLRQTKPVHGWRRAPALMLNVRSHLLSSLLDGIRSPDDKAILAAIMFGMKSGMHNTQKDTFRKSGMLHLFAVSGLHVGIIFSLVVIVMNLVRVPFRWRYGLAPAILLLYVCLTGAESSAVRAWLMLTVWSLGKSFYLPGKALNTVMVAALLLLLANPLNLFHIGFQYSFLLVTAILCGWRLVALVWKCYSMPLKLIPARSQAGIRWQYKVRQIVITTAGAMGIFWLGGFGLTVRYSNLVLPMSILSNIVVGFLAWGIMGLGWLKILLNTLHIPGLPHLVSGVLEGIVHILGNLANGVSTERWVYGVGKVPFIVILIYYATFFTFVTAPCEYRSMVKRITAVAISIAAIVYWPQMAVDTLRVEVLLPNSSSMPVICIREGTRVTLVNCGPKGFQYSLANWLRGEGIRRIDRLIVVDGKAQSSGGLVSLREAVSVPTVYQLSGRKLTKKKRAAIPRFRYCPTMAEGQPDHSTMDVAGKPIHHIIIGCSPRPRLVLTVEQAEGAGTVLKIGERMYRLDYSDRDILVDSVTIN